MRKILIKYYSVWYLAHKNSKHAKDFDNYWFHAFLQVCETIFALLVILDISVKILFNIHLRDNGYFIIGYLLLPAVILYYFIFTYSGIEKNPENEYFNNLGITSKAKCFSWIFFVMSNVIMMLLIAYNKQLATLFYHV